MKPRIIPGDEPLAPEELTAEQLAMYIEILEHPKAWNREAIIEARRYTTLVILLREVDR